jgi:hypothetical protein
MIAWEGRSCQRHGIEGSMFGAAFYGEQGTLVLDGTDCRWFDKDDKPVRQVSGAASEVPHLQNFLDCIRTGGRPNADIAEGHRSTLLCHLGNIAWRTGRTLNCDRLTGRIVGDRGAGQFWRLAYRRGWEPGG